MTQIRISHVELPSYVDGSGPRAVLFLQGCSIRCPGCQNQTLWDADGGHMRDIAELAGELEATDLPITITGGEPFDQAEALLQLLWQIRDLDPDRHIIVYSGRTFPSHTTIRCGTGILAEIDVLVDGPYIVAQDSPDMQFRGSTNQRVIDMRATLGQLWVSDLQAGKVIELDWDSPIVSITDEGDLVGAAPVVEQFAGEGTLQTERRCGQA